ncbi:MAG: guanylate kinase [Candidatus Omnitrophica bacterium]|nr:guanylate kinase [Candidatus Omnitrophota bacterium]
MKRTRQGAVKGKIFILSGPSGSGKTTLYKNLLANQAVNRRLVKTISLTTRMPRLGERDGRDYFFVSRRMFQHKKKAGHFLECEEVFGNYYGTPRKQVADFLKAGKHVLLCIDVKGAKTVSRQFPRAVKIFIKTPSLAVLRQRLANRGSEKEEALRARLATVHGELKEAKHYDYVIVNDRLSKATKQLAGIVRREVKSRL